jgi:hypothetical protein
MLGQVARSQLTSIDLNRKLNSKDIVFIWVPKTAGTSVYTAMRDTLGLQLRKTSEHFLSFPNRGSVTFGHVAYQQLFAMGAVSKKYHKRAFKFSFVRNPYTRAVSLYNYLNQHGIICKEMSFEQFLEEVFLYRPPVGLYNHRGLSQANPQADWIIGFDQKPLTNEIYKVEDMDVFVRDLKQKFDVTFNASVKLNKSTTRLSVADAFENQACCELVRTIYARDFSLFDYDINTIPGEEAPKDV